MGRPVFPDHVETHLRPFGADLLGTHIGIVADTISGHRLGHRGPDGAHMRVINTEHGTAVKGQMLQKINERLLQLAEIMGIGIHMISIDIGHRRHHRVQIQERSIRFIGFSDQKIALPKQGIGAGRSQPPADNKRRIKTGMGENGRHQTGSGGFAMGAGNGNALLQAHQFGQHHRAGHDGNAPLTCGNDFRILIRHRTRHHHHIGHLQIFRAMAKLHPRTRRAQALYRGAVGQIGTGHLIAKVEQHLGNAAHADATDADEMDVFNLMFHDFLKDCAAATSMQILATS